LKCIAIKKQAKNKDCTGEEEKTQQPNLQQDAIDRPTTDTQEEKAGPLLIPGAGVGCAKKSIDASGDRTRATRLATPSARNSSRFFQW